MNKLKKIEDDFRRLKEHIKPKLDGIDSSLCDKMESFLTVALQTDKKFPRLMEMIYLKEMGRLAIAMADIANDEHTYYPLGGVDALASHCLENVDHNALKMVSNICERLIDSHDLERLLIENSMEIINEATAHNITVAFVDRFCSQIRAALFARTGM